MKKSFAGTMGLLLIGSLSACGPVGQKQTSFSIIYGAAAVLSLLLLIACCRTVREKKRWFVVLCTSVLVVNIGYTLLSVSSGLEMALMANRVAYLGSVFLPVSMLMILLQVTNTPYGKRVPAITLGLAVIVFAITASPGILDIYYKEVSFTTVNGVAILEKVYGPLHPLYLVYLLGYLGIMLTVIIRARIRKTIDSMAHAVVLTMAVLVNIGVWFIEQLIRVNFEFLSVSYIISVLFLLGIYRVMAENRKLRQLVKQMETIQNCPDTGKSGPEELLETPVEAETISPERMELFVQGLGQLTATEKTIYEAYIARATTKEVLANLGIKENTLKYHNRNLYGKLGVASRKELLEIYKQMRAVKARLEETNGSQNR